MQYGMKFNLVYDQSSSVDLCMEDYKFTCSGYDLWLTHRHTYRQL